MILRRLAIIIVCLAGIVTGVAAQGSGGITKDLLGSELNSIQTTVPFTTISPDSRGGAMGDLGVATSPDVNSQHWNAAKYVFNRDKAGISLTYTPWLRNLVNDINLAYLSAFYRFDDRQAISGSLKYFSMGEIIFRDMDGVETGEYTPNEFALDLGYSRLLSEYLSASLALRFIRSDITGGGSVDGQQYNAGYSFAADLGLYYQRQAGLGGMDGEFAWGLNFSNLGTKISYTEGSDKQFIPANLRLGARYTLEIDEYNSFTLAADLNKLLVPTPPKMSTSGDTVLFGKKIPSSLPLSWIQSFYDAPGGFKEEMKEIMISAGVEYWYHNQFAMRLGYFNESDTKGNRKFFTAGIGLKFNVFFLDFSYLISTKGKNNPLANTMRFTLGMNFPEGKKRQ